MISDIYSGKLYNAFVRNFQKENLELIQQIYDGKPLGQQLREILFKLEHSTTQYDSLRINFNSFGFCERNLGILILSFRFILSVETVVLDFSNITLIQSYFWDIRMKRTTFLGVITYPEIYYRGNFFEKHETQILLESLEKPGYKNKIHLIFSQSSMDYSGAQFIKKVICGIPDEMLHLYPIKSVKTGYMDIDSALALKLNKQCQMARTCVQTMAQWGTKRQGC